MTDNHCVGGISRQPGQSGTAALDVRRGWSVRDELRRSPYSSRRGATYHDISRGFPHLFRKVKQPLVHRLWPT